jgi:hypothetical protein
MGNHSGETTVTCVAAEMAVAEVYGVVVEVYGRAVLQACGSGMTMVIRTQNSNGTRH